MARRGKGEGSIRKRKDGTWEARYTIGRTADGKQERISIFGKEREEVKDKLIEELNNLNTGNYIKPSKMTVKAWLDTWFNEYVLPTKRASTARFYDDIIKVHLSEHIGHILLKDLRPDHVQKMINDVQKQIPYRYVKMIEKLEKKLEKDNDNKLIIAEIEEYKEKRISARTINHIVVVLGTALDQAMKSGLIHKNIAKLVQKPSIEETEIEYLSWEEIDRLKLVSKTHDLGFAIELTLSTGLRQSELLGLRWSDVDRKEGTLSVRQTISRQRDFEDEKKKTKIVKGKPKTKKGNRKIPIAKATIEKFNKHQEKQNNQKETAGDLWDKKSDLIFTSSIGTPLEPRKLLKAYHDLLKMAGLKKRGFHSLRHTFATEAVKAGIDVKTLSELLGHEDVSTTLNLYIHSSDDTKRKQMQKLEYLFA